MKVSELKKENLEREYEVTVDAKAIDRKMEEELKSIGNRVKIPGFRPGHIPVKVLRQRYGKSVLGDVLEKTVSASSAEVLKSKGDRPAMQPKIEILHFDEGKSLQFKMAYEVLPEIPELDLAAIALEKPVCEIPESEIKAGLERLAERRRSYQPQPKETKAKKGDAVRIDFTGYTGGKPFQGGAAKGHVLELGSGQFIPGFEDQLVGTSSGEETTVKVTFPKDYHKDDLAGQEAEFKVTVHEVLKAELPKIDDEFAKSLGLESLDKLRAAVEDQLRKDFDQITRTKLKKKLFDKLEDICKFDSPKAMVELEFNSIWERLQEAKKQGDESLDKPESELREEYHQIAERRVRLGLLLADIGRRNNLKVGRDELSRAVMEQAQMFPGQENKIFEFYQQNPQHLEELRGPILEEKAVDFIFDKIKLTEKKITVAELLAEEEAEEASSSGSGGKKPKKEAKAKEDEAASAKKTPEGGAAKGAKPKKKAS